MLPACRDISHAWTLWRQPFHPRVATYCERVSATRGRHLTHPGNGHKSLGDLFKAVRKEASKLAKAGRGSLEGPESSDPPGDWRIYIEMEGEGSRAPRTQSDVPPGWDNRPATQRHRGTGMLPVVPAEELRTMRMAATGQAVTDTGQETVETPDNPARCTTRGLSSGTEIPSTMRGPQPPAHPTDHAWLR